MAEQLTVTPGTEWRKKVRGGVLLRLPSGFVARVRGVQPDALLRLGKVPDMLTSVIANVMEGKTSPEEQETAAALLAQCDLLDAICTAALVEPRVVADPQADGEIALEDLEMADKQFLMGVLGATTRDLEHFRDKQARHVEPVDASAGHEAAREPDPEPATVGEGEVGV